MKPDYIDADLGKALMAKLARLERWWFKVKLAMWIGIPMAVGLLLWALRRAVL